MTGIVLIGITVIEFCPWSETEDKKRIARRIKGRFIIMFRVQGNFTFILLIILFVRKIDKNFFSRIWLFCFCMFAGSSIAQEQKCQISGRGFIEKRSRACLYC